MGTLDLTTVELVSTLRQAPLNGPTNSQDFNDSQTEVLADLASISGFINDLLIPMLDGLSLAIQPINVTAPHGLEGRYIFSDTSDLTAIFFDSLSNQPLSIAESLKLLQGIIQAVQVTVANLNVEVTALQTQLSSTNQNDIAQALQNFSADLISLTAQVVANTESISNNIILLETNGTTNDVQNKLNLVAGSNVTISQVGGNITISSTGGGGGSVELKTNGSDNSSQTVLNLKNGTGISITSGGSGDVTVASTIGDPVGLSHGGTAVDLSATGGTTKILAQDVSHVISARDLVAADIPNLDVAKITTGQLALARGGTHADLSATGGASFVLRQASVGANITVSQLSQSDLTSGAIASGSTATTQTPSDNSTKIATTAYADAQAKIPPVALTVFIPGVGTNAQTVVRFKVSYGIKFLAGAALSQASASANATADTTYTFKKNGSAFATVLFHSGGTTFTYTQASDSTFVAGDLFEIDGPATADATLADIGLTFQGNRT